MVTADGNRRDGDPGALYERLGPSLHRYAVMILANPVEAEDAVHQVFAALVRRGTSDLDAPEPYLRTAVRNECFSQLRRRQADSAGSDALLEACSAADDRPDERIALEAALRGIPPDQREVVHLKVFEGLTFQEIANLTSESINTVASRYRYAMQKLRVMLAPESAR